MLLVVLWRLRSKLGLHDVAEMFLVRGSTFTHEAVWEWAARFAPLLAEHLCPTRRGHTGRSWYVDETDLKVDGRWCCLYRAIDRDGNLVDVLLSETRAMAAAQGFFRHALETVGPRPAKVTTDGHDAYPRAVREVLGKDARHRTRRYLNQLIEPDNRPVKQHFYPMRGFKTVRSAAHVCSASYQEQWMGVLGEVRAG